MLVFGRVDHGMHDLQLLPNLVSGFEFRVSGFVCGFWVLGLGFGFRVSDSPAMPEHLEGQVLPKKPGTFY